MRENNFRPLRSVQRTRGTRSKPDSLTVVLSNNGSSKLVFSRGLCKKLHIYNKVFLLTDGETLLISGSALHQGCPDYNVCSYSADRKVLYSYDIAHEVAKILSLDFSSSVSQILTDIGYLDNDDGILYAFICNNLDESF